jgi:hypothetical protein
MVLSNFARLTSSFVQSNPTLELSAEQASCTIFRNCCDVQMRENVQLAPAIRAMGLLGHDTDRMNDGTKCGMGAKCDMIAIGA